MLFLLTDFSFRRDFFREIFMGSDPAATRHRLTYNLDRSSIGRRDVLLGQFTLCDLREQLRAILLGISTKGSLFFAMFKKLKKRQSRLNDLGRDAVEFDIAGVTKHHS